MDMQQVMGLLFLIFYILFWVTALINERSRSKYGAGKVLYVGEYRGKLREVAQWYFRKPRPVNHRAKYDTDLYDTDLASASYKLYLVRADYTEEEYEEIIDGLCVFLVLVEGSEGNYKVYKTDELSFQQECALQKQLRRKYRDDPTRMASTYYTASFVYDPNPKVKVEWGVDVRGVMPEFEGTYRIKKYNVREKVYDLQFLAS